MFFFSLVFYCQLKDRWPCKTRKFLFLKCTTKSVHAKLTDIVREGVTNKPLHGRYRNLDYINDILSWVCNGLNPYFGCQYGANINITDLP